MNVKLLLITIFVTIIVGCSQSEYQTIPQVIGSELKNVKQIDIRYGDGTFVSLKDDPKDIGQIVETLKKIHLKGKKQEDLLPRRQQSYPR